MKQRVRRINYHAFGITDVGRKRPNNEDAFLINKELQLFAVADGMGGHEKGEVASRTALEVIEKVAGTILPSSDEDTLGEGRKFTPNEDLAKTLILKANEELCKRNRVLEEHAVYSPPPSGPPFIKGREKMGTTVVCAMILGGKFYVFYSGDSRCYHMSDGSLHRLTEDHSPAEELVQSGLAAADEPKVRAMRNRVRGSLGFSSDIDPDVVASIPKRGDIYLLCSDGLTGMLSDEKIQTMLKDDASIEKKCKNLVHMANELGGKDNITVVMVEISSVDTSLTAEPGEASEKEKGAREDTLRDL